MGGNGTALTAPFSPGSNGGSLWGPKMSSAKPQPLPLLTQWGKTRTTNILIQIDGHRWHSGQVDTPGSMCQGLQTKFQVTRIAQENGSSHTAYMFKSGLLHFLGFCLVPLTITQKGSQPCLPALLNLCFTDSLRQTALGNLHITVPAP